jgi:two-component system nitrogen regulation response regulator GlnG
LVGSSPAIRRILRTVEGLRHNESIVLVTGESGTGKEVVARALHAASGRRHGPFVPVDCGALPESIIESELFGHQRGAFTGAVGASGLFRMAEGGTLFLDEIGDMPPDAQTRLLRVLQEGEFTPVGTQTPVHSDVRIVAATHRDLRQLIEQGRFREDLYYRLNVVPLRLPPLRERRQDIPVLARHFLNQAGEDGLPVKSFDEDAIDVLAAHNWPGNVRELENLVRRLVVLVADDVIGPDDVRSVLDEAIVAKREPETGGLSERVEQHLRTYFDAHGDTLPTSGLYERILREIERPLITLTLAATQGNQVRAADVLGINRNTLRKKIRELDIAVPRGGGAS